MVDALGERATFNNILILMEERLRKGEAPTIFPSPLVRDANVIAPVINIHSEITGYRLGASTEFLHAGRKVVSYRFQTESLSCWTFLSFLAAKGEIRVFILSLISLL